MMQEKVRISNTFRMVSLALAVLGAICFIAGLRINPEVTWGSYLVAAYYFLSLSIGASFFLCIQNITQSGWSSAFRRVSESMMAWIPFAAVFFLLLYFGMDHIYHWSAADAAQQDPLLQHKSPVLNVSFFFISMIISFAAWIILSVILRRLSLKEDSFSHDNQDGILSIFRKQELYSKIFIFVLALTFSISVFVWLMSLQPHWFSSIFAFKNFIGAFLHGTTIITLIIFILYRNGHFTFLNKYHIHDFARYIFILCIIWGYMWFSQFMIIWYGNIPEETVYYFYRWQIGWKLFFWLQIGLNWGVPFMVLLPVKTSRNMAMVTAVIIIMIIGQYIDLFVQIMPPVAGDIRFGWIEAGIFAGFAGLYAFVVATTLGKANLVPSNHPYLVESLEHQFE